MNKETEIGQTVMQAFTELVFEGTWFEVDKFLYTLGKLHLDIEDILIQSMAPEDQEDYREFCDSFYAENKTEEEREFYRLSFLAK